jgi:hypothetical protein
MEDECGELFHFGSVCATKHSGYSTGVINKQIADRQDELKRKANKEFNATYEAIAYRSKMLQAHKLRLCLRMGIGSLCGIGILIKSLSAGRGDYE